MAFYGIIKIVIMSLYNLIYICAGILTQRTGVVNLVLFPMCRPVASGSAPARRRRDKAPNIYIVALRIPYLARGC